ncbi:SIMPL domain-containing protein [Aliiroseovarius sp. F20344]|uniref:SIMPL domain-containing protein n=1 Tax=Aliiroseovarius sp. F20344 TaxID=2926414 RepID=UPI001FF68D41|nr:SIMPL domain-containing protein [Aliiroseovarius sp. F20344]MCK0143804.1 SIMPL domain-containing protein [Aliiroseovarius sp. F20344]
MRKLLSIIAISIAAAGIGHAEISKASQLTVTGQGVAQVVPDMARISLGVSERSDDAGAAFDAVADAIGQMLAKLTEAGVDERDVQSTQVSLSAQYDYNRQNEGVPKLVGFIANSTLSVGVRDLTKLGAIMSAVTSVGANEIHGLQFDIQDRNAAEDSARSLAVKDAMSRATVLAEAAGMKLGSVLMMQEGGDMGGRPVMMAMERASADMPVAAGELGVNSSVTMVFELIE